MLESIELTLPINPILFIVLTLALIALSLWIRDKEFRYSKLIKIILFLLLAISGIIIFLIICIVCSTLTAIFVAIALYWIKGFFFGE